MEKYFVSESIDALVSSAQQTDIPWYCAIVYSEGVGIIFVLPFPPKVWCAFVASGQVSDLKILMTAWSESHFIHIANKQ